MRQDKNIAIRMRHEGATYAFISEKLGVTKSTLSAWFKNEEFSRKIRRKNSLIQIKRSKEHLFKLNNGRRIRLDLLYSKARVEAEKSFGSYKNKPLFLAGLMLYAGEGDKTKHSFIRLANSDIDIHRVFINFLLTFMEVTEKDVRISLLLYEDNNPDSCVIMWSKKLGIPEINFIKPYFIKGRHKIRRLHYGIGTSIISGRVKKEKLLRWIELAKEEYGYKAGMV